MPCPNERIQYLDKLFGEKITNCSVSCNSKTYEAYRGSVRTSKGSEISIQPNTPFNIGSVTKIITASLIIKLVEEGLLTLDDPVSTYIETYRYPHTIQQLMLHTAGYGD